MNSNNRYLIVVLLFLASCGEEMVQKSGDNKIEGVIQNDSLDVDSIEPNVDTVLTIDSADIQDALTGYTANNIKYTYEGQRGKSTIEEGDVFSFHYKLLNTDGKEIRSSYENTEPFALKQGLELMPKAIDKALPGLYYNSRVNLKVACSHPEIEKFPSMGHKEGDSLVYQMEIKKPIKPIITGVSKVYKMVSGKGAKIEAGDKIGIDYFGFTPDGKIFMTSRDAGASYEFPVGKGRVVQGLDSAFLKLNIGDKVIVDIPAKYGYGSKGLLDKVKPNTDITYMLTIDYKK